MSWGDWGFVDTPEVSWRLAMAWDDWKDKIIHDPPSYDNQGDYTITHGPGQNSVLMYSLNAEGPEDNSVFIDNLFTDPDFQRQGVAEAFFRRLHQDYPDRKINPGAMFPDGQAFHDRMLQKEPMARDLVTARRLFLAMAWDEWAPKIKQTTYGDERDEVGCMSGECSYDNNEVGSYAIEHDDGIGESSVTYGHYKDDEGNPYLGIVGLETDEDYRNDGVAESLIRRIHQDHPGIKIDPGFMTDDGQGFHDRMLEKEPDARSIVAQANRLLLAMAWNDWAPLINGGCEGAWGKEPCARGSEGRYTISQAGAFLNYSHDSHMGKPEIKVETIYTHPQNRNDGVAEALMRRLAEDHPGVPINPGLMTRDGQGFHDKMLEKEPRAKDLVTAAMQVLAMAKRLGPGYYEHQTEHGKFHITQVNNPDYRGSSWYLHYPSEHDPHNQASDYPDDVFRTKRDALAVANEWKGRE